MIHIRLVCTKCGEQLEFDSSRVPYTFDEKFDKEIGAIGWHRILDRKTKLYTFYCRKCWNKKGFLFPLFGD